MRRRTSVPWTKDFPLIKFKVTRRRKECFYSCHSISQDTYTSEGRGRELRRTTRASVRRTIETPLSLSHSSMTGSLFRGRDLPKLISTCGSPFQDLRERNCLHPEDHDGYPTTWTNQSSENLGNTKECQYLS